MVDRNKLELIRSMVAQGQITLRAEPRRGNYLTGYEPSANADENHYAVYGESKYIRQLEQEGCIARKKGPSLEYDKTHSKAYLSHIAPANIMDLCEVSAPPYAGFAAHGFSRYTQPAMALYHTPYAIEGASGDTLSYFAMSASNRQQLEMPMARLTDPAHPQLLQMRHVDDPNTEMLLLPVRRSMADRIALAHPEAWHIEGGATSDRPVSGAAMHAIMDQLHRDQRFIVPAVGKRFYVRPEPEEPAVAAPAPPIKKQPLKDWIAELAPYVERFDRHEQIGGGISSKLVMKMSPELPEMMRQVSSKAHCPDRGEFQIPVVNASAGTSISVGINDATYNALHAQLPSKPVHIHVQPLHHNLLRSRPTQVNGNPDNKPRMRIEQLRLARTEQEDGTIQNWLVVTAPHLKRAALLASDLGIAVERQRPITHGGEQPAILLLPVSATVAESLGANNKVERNETPYETFDEMAAALRAGVTEKHLFSDLPPPPSETRSKTPRPATPKRGDAEVIRDAGEVLFQSSSADDRAWLHYLRNSSGVHNKRHEMVRLGVKVPAAGSRQFIEDMLATGFTELPGRDYAYVGSTGKGGTKYRIYQFKLMPKDLEAWGVGDVGEKHWPAVKDEERPRHHVMLTDDQVEKRLHTFLSINEREHPRDTSWRRLAVLANSGAIRCMQVRHSADDIEYMGHEYMQELDALKKGVEANAAALKMQHERWKERRPPIYLNPVDDASRKLMDQVPNTAKSMLSLGSSVDDVTEGHQRYHEWLQQQPRNEDGSVTLQFLVMPKPSSNTLHHLRQADHFSVADGQGRLLPQEGFVFDINSQKVQVRFCTQGFIGILAAHDGHLESTHDQPVMLSEVEGHLREVFPPREKEVMAPDHAARANEMEAMRRHNARKRIMEQHFPGCRNNILYGQLRAENNFAKLGDRPAHDRIGTQHGLLMHMERKSEWNQIKKMLDDMERGAMLGESKSYVMPLGAVDPAMARAALDAAEQNRDALADVTFAIQAFDAQPDSADKLASLKTSIAAFIVNTDNLPEPLQPLAASLSEVEPVEQIRLVRRAVRECHDAVHQQRLAYREADETYDQAIGIARRDGMMKQGHIPPFRLEGDKEGKTLDEIDALVTEHFKTNGLRAPITVATYLSGESGIKGDFSDEKMFDWLKQHPPARRWTAKMSLVNTADEDTSSLGEQNQWTRRLRQPVRCPSNVTLDGFFGASKGIFVGPQHAR